MTQSPNPTSDPTPPVDGQSWWRQPVPSAAVVSPLEIVALAIMCGSGGGLLEGVILLFRRFALHQFINTTAMVVWMAPLAYLFIYAVLGAGPLLLRLIFRRQISLQVVAVVFGAWAAFGPITMLLHRHVHGIAILLLSLGTGMMFGRLVIRLGVRRRLIPVAAGLLAITAVLAVGMTKGEEWLEARGIARLPEPQPGVPNVLLIILDTVRGESLSLYGYNQPTTPNIEEWAKEGTVFDRAIAPAPWTLPSHITMFTGRLPHETAANWETPFMESYPTLAESFAAEGYLTGAFVANLRYASSETGLLRGFGHRDDIAVSRAQLKLSPELTQANIRRRTSRGHWRHTARKNARTTIDRFLWWLDDAPDRPFFAFINLFDAHEPFVTKPKFLRAFADSTQPSRALYDAAIASMDEDLGLLRGELQARGLLDNTIVILTSDHGELLGEHGLTGHANGLFMPLLHVPLVLWYRGVVPEGIRIRDGVSLSDLAATISRLAELSPDTAFPGTSLTRFWDSTVTGKGRSLFSTVTRSIRRRITLPTSRGPLASMIEGDWHYIIDEQGFEELYDTRMNPAESRNLAARNPPPAVIEELRSGVRAEVHDALPETVPSVILPNQ